MKQVILRRHTYQGIKEEIIKVGSNCFIGHCGSGTSVLGENGKVTKISDRYIYCTSESGSIVKYNIEKKCVFVVNGSRPFTLYNLIQLKHTAHRKITPIFSKVDLLFGILKNVNSNINNIFIFLKYK